MKILCQMQCGKEKTQVKEGLYVCDDCQPPKFFGGGNLIETVHVRGYGNVSKKRIDEVTRRVILPYKKEGGGYYVGRRSETGKIEEKHPNY